MITLPRIVCAAFVAATSVLAFVSPAHAAPSTPMVPSSIGPIPASAAMPRAGEAVHPSLDCYNSGQPGGPIAQATVLARAAVWVAQNVPYTGACASEPGGNYRLDCSGFVSMAWGLSTSLSTVDFNPATNGGDQRFTAIPRDTLSPGDAVVADNSTARHIALFTGWGTSDNGQHRYANLSQESTYNVGTIAVYNQDLLGSYWGKYTPIRYSNVQRNISPGTTAIVIEGIYHAFWVSAGGHLMYTYYRAGWHRVDLGGGDYTGTPAVTHRTGRTDVFVDSTSGKLSMLYYDTQWRAAQQILTGWQGGVSAFWDGQGNHIYGHNVSGALVQGRFVNGGWHTDVLGGTTVGSPTVVAQAGRVDIMAVSPTDRFVYQMSWVSGVGWSSLRLVSDSAAFSGDGITALLTGSSMQVFGLTSSGVVAHLWYNAGWLGPDGLGGPYVGVPGVVYQNSRCDVFTTGSDGGVYQRTWTPSGWGAAHRVV